MNGKHLLGAALVLVLAVGLGPSERTSAQERAQNHSFSYLEGKDCEVELINGGFWNKAGNSGTTCYVQGLVKDVDQFGFRVKIKKLTFSDGSDGSDNHKRDGYFPWGAVLKVEPM